MNHFIWCAGKCRLEEAVCRMTRDEPRRLSLIGGHEPALAKLLFNSFMHNIFVVNLYKEINSV